MNSKILITTYYSKWPYSCQAEWIDDKVVVLLQNNYKIDLISNIVNSRSDEYETFLVPSLSLHDFKTERDARRSMLNRGLDFKTFFLLPIIYTFGLTFDMFQTWLTGGLGEGRWSWAITSFFPILYRSIVNRPNVILSTGGPASAHVSSIFVSKLLRIPLVVELQDPLTGDGIGRSSSSSKYLSIVEGFIVKNSTRVVYVTENAARFAKEKYKAENIVAIYPGSQKFHLDQINTKNVNNKFTMMHMGTLYSTRNLNTICRVIDELIDENEISVNDIKIINLGHVCVKQIDFLNSKEYIEVVDAVSRREALQRSLACDLNLLIQNTDSRSNTTIPYKTYDYLNLKNLILCIHNNNELKDIIESHGHIAIKYDDYTSLKNTLKDLIKGFREESPLESSIDFEKQVLKLVELV